MVCVVVADDLTGANATGVLLQKNNYYAYTAMNLERLELQNETECDCIIYPTDSRSISASLAYNRVYNVTNLLKREHVLVYAKRIDSTLRGNLGPETDAMLDALGEDYIAVAAPCFPQSGRVICGGYMLVNGVALHQTEAAIDPKNPVHTSCVQELFKEQSKYPAASFYLNDYMQGKEQLAEKIIHLKKQGVRTMIFDCITQEDLDFIGDAVLASGINFIAVDPGPFTATMARKRMTPREYKKDSKILAVVGSVNPVAKNQMEELLLSQNVMNVFVRTIELAESETRRGAEINRVVSEVLDQCEAETILSIVGDGIYPENRIDFEYFMQRDHRSKTQICDEINTSFAKMAQHILQGCPDIKGIYTSGGDITVAVSKQFEAAGIRLLGEIVPLAAYGEFLGGVCNGMKVVTKGGMAGDPNAMRDCIRYLKEKLYI